jgi:hypothetical protein
MALAVTGQVGEVNIAGGTQTSPNRQGNQGDVIVSELNGRFYEQNARGRTYSGGMTLTAINNVTFTSATLGATCTPIAGVWNPPTSGVNLEMLQAILALAITAATSTGGGPFVWAVSVGNNAALTAALVAWNRKTLSQSGGQGKNLAGVALTGLTTNLVVVGASALQGGSAGNYSQVDTAVGFSPGASGTTSENLDGQFIVPPGGILALLATTTPVAHSAASNLLWNEVPPAT